MTAEVAVMNRLGVALAADSAVTIGSLAQKIYTSAEKLFQLSEAEPVGVMVYGNAGYVSLPWETIIKAFRRKLGSTKRETVGEYADEFVSFLKHNPELFPDENRQHVMLLLLKSALVEVRRHRRDLLDAKHTEKRQSGGGPLTASEIESAFTESVRTTLKIVTETPVIAGVDQAIRSKVKTWVDLNLQEAVEEVLEGITLPNGIETELATLAVEYLTRESLQNYKSGIVIAGFGTTEYMPSLANFEVEECVDSLPRLTATKHTKITTSAPAYVMPYAQKDSVSHFLWGVDESLLDFMAESVRNLSTGIVNEIVSVLHPSNPQLATAVNQVLSQSVNANLDKMFDKWVEAQVEYYQPVLDTIAVLPKDELGATAEALVNLTKFRRRVTPEPETVSGPIDVAVITKGDGFVWVRRKHYFSPEINPRVIARLHHNGGQS